MFILICRYNRVIVYPGDDVTLSSNLSPETSAVAMEVRWFKGAECVCLYKNGQVTVGRGFEGRAGIFTRELAMGNVSLVLKDIRPTDTGTYVCQVLTGQDKVEKSVSLYMAGTEPLSPDRLGPTFAEPSTEQSATVLELKQFLQKKESELQGKVRELETLTDMVRSKSSLLQYKDTDLENMSKQVAENQERMNSLEGQLKMYRSEVETLGQALQERNNQVKQLAGVLQEREQELAAERRLSADELEKANKASLSAEDSAHVQELKNLLEQKEQELQDKSADLDGATQELRRMASLLQQREADLQNKAQNQLKNMVYEVELCKTELEALGRELMVKNSQVQQLTAVLRDKDFELEERLKTVAGTLSHGAFPPELLEKSEAMVSKMFSKPDGQLKDIECWIQQKREENQIEEEEDSAELLQKQFQGFAAMIGDLLQEEYGNLASLAQFKAKLEAELERAETDEELEGLKTQLSEVVHRQNDGARQIERLTQEIDRQRLEIEQRHEEQIAEIREKYNTVSRVEAETGIQNIILPEVQAYFRNIAADLKSFLDRQRERVTSEEIAGETNVLNVSESNGVETNEGSESGIENLVVEAEGQEMNNNDVATVLYESVEQDTERESTESPRSEQRPKIVNSVKTGRKIQATIEEEEETDETNETDETEEEEGQEYAGDVREHVETGENDIR